MAEHSIIIFRNAPAGGPSSYARQKGKEDKIVAMTRCAAGDAMLPAKLTARIPVGDRTALMSSQHSWVNSEGGTVPPVNYR